jgi:ParB family chromosome partitioning protein
VSSKRRNFPELTLRGVDNLNTDSGTFVLLEELHLPPSQPRRYFDEERMQELISSIRMNGILQPLLVRPLAQGQGYEIVAGERRYRSAQAIGLKEVPVIIRSMTDEEATRFSLIENLQREGLNPIEEVEGILNLLSLQLEQSVPEVKQTLYRLNNQVSKKGNHNVVISSEAEGNHNAVINSEETSNHNVVISPEMGVVQEVFNSLGRMSWETFTRNRLPLLNLPDELLEALRQGKLAYTKAKAIAKVKDEAARQKLLEDAIALELSLSQIREQIKELQSSPQGSKPQKIVDTTAKRIKSAKLWESDPEKWEQLQSLLQEINKLIEG